MNEFMPKSVCYVEIPSPDLKPPIEVVMAIIQFQMMMMDKFAIRTCQRMIDANEQSQIKDRIAERMTALGISNDDQGEIADEFALLYVVPQDCRFDDEEVNESEVV